jgi:hypothetical protein
VYARAVAVLRELATRVIDRLRGTASGELPILAELGQISGPLLDDGVARARNAWGLSPFEVDVLVAVTAPDVDERFARAYGVLNGHPERTRPTFGSLLDWLGVKDDVRPRALAVLLGERPLRQLGIIELDGAGPITTRPMRAAFDVPARLLGLESSADAGVEPHRADALDRLVLADATRTYVTDLARATRLERPLVVVHGSAGAGRHALARAIAHSLGYAALAIRVDELATLGLARIERAARWHNAALVVEDPGDAPIPDPLATLDLPQVWVIGRRGVDRLPFGGREPYVLGAERPDAATREAMWTSALGREAIGVDLELVARRYRLGAGAIQRAAGAARAATRVAAVGDAAVDTARVIAACRTMASTDLETLAQRLPCKHRLADLVVSDATRRELDFALAWARHERLIFETWGMASRLPLGRGLACLFAGPPGTGKTMAAEIVGRELELDVYRVDLSRLVSKYIGETEKNLDRVFDLARAANAVLLFDEADALFGKRTEVRDAHDRYANIETGFLLQRIEVHDGITILTTNLRRNIDDAFQRRIHVIADFAMPGPGERARIWEQKLPPAEYRARDVDVPFVAERFELSGGLIRNAAVASTVFAAGRSSPVDMVTVLCAALREQLRAGRLVEPSQLGPWEASVRERIGRVGRPDRVSER